jgi:hypothetical protein
MRIPHPQVLIGRLGFVPVPEEEEGFPFFEIEFQARE